MTHLSNVTSRRSFLIGSSCVGGTAALETTLPSKFSSAAGPSHSLSAGDLMDVTKVPGVALVGRHNGRTTAQFLGVRSSQTGESVTADTIFPAASLSKVVFAWAVSDLVRKGKLEWNQPLAKYADLGLEGSAARITTQHVLTHSTGLPNWRFKENEPLTSSFEPGTQWSYSGEGIFLLQRVVEKIVGESAASYMRGKVLPTLGIKTGTYAWNPAYLATAALGHDRAGLLLERSLAFYENSNYEILRAAGLDPEAATLDRIIEAYRQAKKPVLPILISPNMAGSLWLKPVEYANFVFKVLAKSVARPQDFEAKIEVNKKLSWTIGWGLDRTYKNPTLFHTGDGPGIKNFAWIQPQRDTAVVVFTNGDRGASLYCGMLRKLLSDDAASFYWV